MSDLVNSARYMVNNPSAWDSFDQRASDVIEAQAARIERLEASCEELAEALREAKAALECCYQVTDWPADGSTEQDEAIRKADAALAKLECNNG